MPLRSLRETERFQNLLAEKRGRQRFVHLPMDSDEMYSRPEVTLSDRIRKTGVRIDDKSFQLTMWLPYEIPGPRLNLSTPVIEPQEEQEVEKPSANLRDDIEFSEQTPKTGPKLVNPIDILRRKNNQRIAANRLKALMEAPNDKQEFPKRLDIISQSGITIVPMPEQPKPKQSEAPVAKPPESQPDFKEEDYIKLPNIPISRRKFLIGSAGVIGTIAASTAAGAILSRLGIFKPSEGKPNGQPQSTEVPAGKERFVLGEKADLKLKEFGLKWTPDGHISYFTTREGKKRYFISAADSSWMIETDGKKSLKDYKLSGELRQEQFHEVLKPYENGNFNPDGGYNNGYTGITGVFQVDIENNPMHLIGITHNEQRKHRDDSGSYTASVGIVESSDGGLTWEDKGPIIKGRAPIPPGDRPSGAGQPAGIIKGDYLHIAYIEWNTGADQLYSAKMKIGKDGSLGPVENIVDDKGKLKSVIPVPQGSGYAAVPSLSHNQELQKYLCVFLTNQGFFEATSDDLENWSEAKEIFPFDASNNTAPDGESLQPGQEYIYYPTYLSEDHAEDQNTGKNGVLYYSSRLIGPQGDNEHNLKSVDVTINS